MTKFGHSINSSSCLLLSWPARLLLLLLLQFCLVSTLANSQATAVVEDDESRTGARLGTTVKKALGTESPFDVDTSGDDSSIALTGLIPENSKAAEDLSGYLPEQGSLFNKDTVDKTSLVELDCHMRNLDLCYAGLLSAAGKVLPETDAELESRCDEMRAMSSCIAIYNQRCSTYKFLSSMMPMGGQASSKSMIPKELLDLQVPTELLNGGQRSSRPIRLLDLLELCEPSAKGTKQNRELREKLFALAKCIAPRMKLLAPCINDLKTAMQLFFEPHRKLPVEPACCAVTQFRSCASSAFDGVCGISSFQQLEASLMSSSGGQMMGVLKRVCGRYANDPKSEEFCREVLPARGIKLAERRGRKASKLAKLLDMFSYAPSE